MTARVSEATSGAGPSAREVHPVADLFPMLAADELADLAADIKDRGLLQPVVLDIDGRVLDGRNRLAACELAGVDPEFVTYDGPDPDGYALAVNIARRHLTSGARAIVAAKAAQLSGKSMRDITAGTNLYHPRVAEAAVVLEWAPDKAGDVLSGNCPLSRALETARQRKQDAADLAQKVARLKAAADDLAVLVEEERMSIDDATAALDARERTAREEAERLKAEQEARATAEELQRKADEAAAAERIATTNTVVARSVTTLLQFAEPLARERFITEWDPTTSAVNPEHVTAETFKTLAEAFRELSEEMN